MAQPSKGQPSNRKDQAEKYKTRNWVTIVYPESVPENWRDTLREWCVQAFVSPLHDADTDPNGEPKKPHWHVMLMYDGPRGRKLMERQVKELGGVGCQPCNAIRGYARYLCHLDNPEKHQYDPAQVECYGGADYMGITSLPADRRKLVAEMQVWCRENRVFNFAELCDYARENREDWFYCLVENSTMVMFRYLRSLEDGEVRTRQSEVEDKRMKLLAAHKHVQCLEEQRDKLEERVMELQRQVWDLQL